MVIQSIVGHHAVARRLPMLDQFAMGLKTLNVLDEIRSNPQDFKKIFVHSSVTKTPDYVKALLKIPQDGKKCTDVCNMLIQYIDECLEEGTKRK